MTDSRLARADRTDRPAKESSMQARSFPRGLSQPGNYTVTRLLMTQDMALLGATTSITADYWIG